MVSVTTPCATEPTSDGEQSHETTSVVRASDSVADAFKPFQRDLFARLIGMPSSSLRFTDVMDRPPDHEPRSWSADVLGMPVILNPYVPKGTAYIVNSKYIVWGTWRKPLPSVASIIAFQRRRRT
jgi:hypothetical protein